MNVKEGEVVRLRDYDENDADAKIDVIYPDKSVRLVNMNMPFIGTICDIYTQEEFERITKLKL